VVIKAIDLIKRNYFSVKWNAKMRTAARRAREREREHFALLSLQFQVPLSHLYATMKRILMRKNKMLCGTMLVAAMEDENRLLFTQISLRRK
jgi:hypothetical protein